MPVPFVSGLVSFLISLLVGSLAIYVGAKVIADVEDFGRAAATAIVGAVVWVFVAGLVGWIPLLGAIIAPILALAAWIVTVNLLYPGDVTDAALIGVVAWATAVVVLTVVSLVTPFSAGAFGVPFV